ncbi:MAG: quinol oxidase [Nitrospiraceae bacterium]|nr:MAG: quinol oxidase [Nitrospiraceae bacterium]
MKTIRPVLIFLVITLCALSINAGEMQEVYTAAVDADGVQRIEIFGGGYFFKPSHIIVKKDIPVELIVRKDPGIVPHSFVISSPEAGMDIKESMSSEQKIIRFVPVKAGKYPFYCDKKLLFFKGHRDRGMEGTIEVTE